ARPVPQIIVDAFSPLGPGAVTWALRVAHCESTYNPQAVNGSSGASGLFQFLPSTWARSPYGGQPVFDPDTNARAAAWLYETAGPGQWSCR
ncbi:MAG: transglycosylase SLT domain-containing protein, partial [Candidatus Dormibacteraeota bacterium]|nr:transglycosylase SLT domain-containing protein [Candidatus Dormibacteraeota bacterium]